MRGKKIQPKKNQPIGFAFPFLKNTKIPQREQAQLGVTRTPAYWGWAQLMAEKVPQQPKTLREKRRPSGMLKGPPHRL